MASHSDAFPPIQWTCPPNFFPSRQVFDYPAKNRPFHRHTGAPFNIIEQPLTSKKIHFSIVTVASRVDRIATEITALGTASYHTQHHITLVPFDMIEQPLTLQHRAPHPPQQQPTTSFIDIKFTSILFISWNRKYGEKERIQVSVVFQNTQFDTSFSISHPDEAPT